MRIGKIDFKPRLIPTLATVLLLPVLISLGVWQLGRADEKRAMLAEQARQANLPVLDVNAQTQMTANDIGYRRVQVTGRFDSRYRIYIDNKVHQGKVGYQVVEPLLFDQGNSAILVNRGWVAATQSRTQLPDVPVLAAQQTIIGMLKLNPRDVASFDAGNRSGTDWPALVRWVDIAELQQAMPYELKPFMLLQTNDNPDGLLRDWSLVSSPPEKNQSYALQWFSLALALLLIFIFVNTKKIVR